MATDVEIEKVAIRMRGSLKDVVEAAKEMANFAIEDIRATEVEPLREAIRWVVDTDPAIMRTADQHVNCKCHRCAMDNARAKLGEKE